MRQIFLAAALVIGCDRGGRSPLADLVGMNRVLVHPGRGDSTVVLTEPYSLRALRTVLEEESNGWQPVMHTAPAGRTRVALFRDTVFLGSLGVGPGFLVASGPDRKTSTRSAGSGLLATIHELLDPAAPLRVQVIDVPPRDSAR